MFLAITIFEVNAFECPLKQKGDFMKMGKLILSLVAALNLFCTSAFAGGGDDLDFYCSSSDLKYSASINVEDGPVTIGKFAAVLGPFTGFRRGLVKSVSDSLLIVEAPPTQTLYGITLEIHLDRRTGKAKHLKVNEGYHVQSSNQVHCAVI